MDNYKQDMLSSLLKALSFDGEQKTAEVNAPFGKGNADCLDYFLNLAESFGFKTKNLDGYAGFADIGEGKPFGILGHLDTVPVGEGWTHNPFGEIEDDIIYGRGVLDDRGPMISCLYAIKSLLDEGLTPQKKIRLIFGCNEESGWECINYYNKCETMPDEGFSPDADFPVINCEKGIATLCYEKDYCGRIKMFGGLRPNVVPNLCKATLPYSDSNLKTVINSGLQYTTDDDNIYVTASGKAAHAATPDLGENAIIKMLKALSPIDKDFQELYNAFYSTDGLGAGLNLSDEISGKLTCNLGMIECGTKIRFTINIRYPVSVSESRLVDIIDNCLPNYVATESQFQPPLFIDKDDFLVKTLLETYNQVTNENREAITIGGGTYARALKHGVAFGPEFPDETSTIHMPDERVSVEKFMRFTTIYREAIKRLCF